MSHCTHRYPSRGEFLPSQLANETNVEPLHYEHNIVSHNHKENDYQTLAHFNVAVIYSR